MVASTPVTHIPTGERSWRPTSRRERCVTRSMPRAPCPARCPTHAWAASCLRPDGSEIAVGVHRGAGSPHAEVDALTQAGDEAKGATAVVTLEPCNHTGRTGPCTAGPDRRRRRPSRARADRPRPGRRRRRGRAPTGRDRRRVRCHGRRGRGPERRVDARRDARPPVRDLEVRRHDGRPQRRARRNQQVDHQRGGAPRRPRLPGRGRRGHGRHRHGARRRPSPDRSGR